MKFQKNTKTKRYNLATINTVPSKFFPYLIDLNPVYAKVNSSVILGREKEINRLMNCLMRSKKANAVLLGEHGVGKTAILQKLVSQVIEGQCPKEMRAFHFIYLDVELIISELDKKDKKDMKKIKEMFVFLRSFTNLVVVIDKIHLIEADLVLANEFSTLVITPNAKIIGMSNYEEFYYFFEADTKTRSRLEIVDVLEPEKNQIYPMISKMVQNLEKTHRIRISERLIRYTIAVSMDFSVEICNPEYTLDIIEKAMIISKRRKEKEVSRYAIMHSLNLDFEMFKKTSQVDRELTAYHEAGHYIVGQMSTNIPNFKPTAISIVPADDMSFSGVTLFDYQLEKQAYADKNYYISLLAIDLAGREAEKLYFKDSERFTSGAASDLSSAKNMARKIVTMLGMTDLGDNKTYLAVDSEATDLMFLSEDIRNQIDSEVKKLLNIASRKAEDILVKNRELLDRIAQELLVNMVLDEQDLLEICEAVK